jgi:hypothetical protein
MQSDHESRLVASVTITALDQTAPVAAGNGHGADFVERPRVRSGSVPEVDLRQPSDPERLIQLGAVVDVVAEDPLDHRAARVYP